MRSETVELELQIEISELGFLLSLMIFLVLHEHPKIVDVRCRIQKDATERSEGCPHKPQTGDHELRSVVVPFRRRVSHNHIVPQGERPFIGVYSARVKNSLVQL